MPEKLILFGPGHTSKVSPDPRKEIDMTENEHQVLKDLPDEHGSVEPEFCFVNYAMVLGINIDDIPKVIRYVRSLGAVVHYQTKSLGRLTVKRE
jgi:hypothetical protein